MTGKTDEKALALVDRIVKEMPDAEKEKLFDKIMSEKKVRDHMLKILLWTYCGKDIKKDVERKDNLRKVLDRLESKEKMERKKAANDERAELL